jgi:putative DNA primase/helicase
MSAGGIEAKAGQELRILDIPVTGAHGVFETLHGRASGGLLSDDVRNLAAKHYGHAGPRFVAALVRELRAGFRLADALQSLIERFNAAEGQERRAARTFAVCALAGELAVAWGIVPWSTDDPTRAAVHAFNLWRGRRRTNGESAEHAAILRAVSDFIERYSDKFKYGNERSSDMSVESLAKFLTPANFPSLASNPTRSKRQTSMA